MNYFLKWEASGPRPSHPIIINGREVGGGMECFGPGDLEMVRAANLAGCGVFHVVNSFDWENISRLSGRKKENVTGIRFWCADFDGMPFSKQEKLVNSFEEPSVVVKSKNSLHVYWKAMNANIANYSSIQKRIYEGLGSDRAINHEAVTLRTPGFFHMKDPDDPVMVEKIFESSAIYSEETFSRLLDKRFGTMKFSEAPRAHKSFEPKGNSFFDKLSSLDQGDILVRLSGKLSGDTIELKRGSGQNKNIWVNGECSEAWVDGFGKIGSRNNGGPTALQWIEYYGYSKQQAIEFLKTNITELEGES